jgi:hypothetical protein
LRVKDFAGQTGITKQEHKALEGSSEELKFENLEHLYLYCMRGGAGLGPEIRDHA